MSAARVLFAAPAARGGWESAARVLFAAPAARRALLNGRIGAVEIALQPGAYVRLGRDWLLLAEPSAQFGPLSLAVRGLHQLVLRPGLPARVAGSRLIIGETPLLLERMRERRTAPLMPAPPAEACAIATAVAAAVAALPDAPALLRRGIAALAMGRLREAVQALAGLGQGLTPAGDDVLAGYAALRAALAGCLTAGRSAPEDSAPLSTFAADRASPLGLAYLRCAEHGELPDPGARLLAAIHRGSVEAVRVAIPQLRAYGASSGIALAWGMAAAAGRSATASSSSKSQQRHTGVETA